MRIIPNDRGVTSALFAVFLTVALGVAALVIDVANAWQERRQLVTATDAAALAAAQEFVAGNDGCGTTDNAFVEANSPGAINVVCDPVDPTSTAPGRVTVEADFEVDYFFGPAIGIDGTTVASSSTASYAFAFSIDGGLRPFGLCLENLEAQGVTPGDGETYRLDFGQNGQPGPCSDGENAPGNWALLDFDDILGGQANANSTLADWIENGYNEHEVEIGEVVAGDPGALSNSVGSELQGLVDDETIFTVPIFSVADGAGENGEFPIIDFAVVKLVDYKVTGSQQNGTRFLEFEFVTDVVQGGGGGPGGFGAFVVGLCAVDGLDAAATCINEN